MLNPFFRIALGQAARLLGKPGRLVHLVVRMAQRLTETKRKDLTAQAVREKFCLLGRLISAYARREYRAIPLKTLIAVVAAMIYFLNPIDLIPDAILGIGLTDDLAVLAWVIRSAQQELEAFATWERSAVVCHQTS